MTNSWTSCAVAVRAPMMRFRPPALCARELSKLLQNHEAVGSMGWHRLTNQLRRLNGPIVGAIPRQNATCWIDHLMITSASDNKDLAYRFLEFMIEARTQKKVADV